LDNGLNGGEKSARKGNPVIYLALALPGCLVAVAIASTVVARHRNWAAAPSAISAPNQRDSQSNPGPLIEPKNWRYIG